MIRVGDIVYRVRRGGFIHDGPVTVKDKVGLVIKELREQGTVPQIYVQFNDHKVPSWFYQHDLRKIGGERKKDV
jgi:hypothetical protein